jgi:divalent metal cation (Fe/Co/Zn/Cd) transporter
MWVSVASVIWAMAVGIAAVAAGAAARSVALVAFGIDSLVDGSASILLTWRFSLEGQSPDRAAGAEYLALRLVGVALLSAAAFVSAQAIMDLINRSGPSPTTVGLALAGASVLVLPLLAVIKLRLAGSLGSAALRGDGVLSAAGACLAAAALLGLILAGTFGWWWADSTAALIIATALAWEGWRALSTYK